ncbi:ABC transporter ATP-binding protein [Deinococcus peraridilitoris]|uniref:ABC-type spermidine/putrescine transport system, ATPase component n=1 Tax=Deinococcus peraridilitoris (strain DSM 19664 / LMG 22246 / CIP 109416 / KR-200) TaxID=937777 RepID=L0A5M7_DEIPD|nr:ABC transporter ATP-binding protein [Deinococcus peraridilitoris]AFZ68325.1 ABC-type spermidine/putrescine transport system, ATPase component [Deinococcus peraridilitoris DSM 19664]
MSALALDVREVHKHYGGVRALQGVSLSLPGGETLALLGPSGCGKSTLLRLVAGLEHPDAGHIVMDGRDVTNAPPERRDLSLVFQEYALFPHLSVLGNAAYGPRARGLPRHEAHTRARAALALVSLAQLERRRVSELSGGQQQRVALARALAPRPRLLLLDEPLSNLDERLRGELQLELRALFARLDASVLLVTHDQREALALSNHMALMRAGRIVQSGRTADVHARPHSAWAAAFLGHRNLLPRGREVLLVPEEAIELDAGEPYPVSEARPGDSGVRLRVSHDWGELQLHLSAREAQRSLTFDRAFVRLRVRQEACRLLPDDLADPPGGQA